MMKNKLFIILYGAILFCHAQTGNQSKKPFAFTGSYTLNYEQKKTGNNIPATGKVIYAFNNFDAAIIPSFAKLMQDVVGAKLLVNTSFNEMTMLTITKSGKKSGLLTDIAKPVIEQNSKSIKPPVVIKTGLQKVIQTFPCEKIIITLWDSTKIEAWISNALVLNISEAMRFTNLGFKNKSPFTAINLSALNGSLLETTITSKNGDITKLSVTDIKKIKPDASFFSSNGYAIMDARGLQMR